jgi:hypothetical protein
MLYPK